MDGFILLIILAVFLILLVIIINRTGDQKLLLESLYEKIQQLSREVSSLSTQLKEKTVVSPVTSDQKPVQQQVKKDEEIIVKKEPVPLPGQEKIKPVIPVVAATAATGMAASLTQTKEGSKPIATYDPETDTNDKEERDIEKYIGENLANKIGIGVLVLGIAFFIKYAIDKNWINESGRVLIGLLCGSILIGLAHRLRHKYRSFSSVLVGGGLSVFYFSIAFAFHEYHLIGQTMAFALMVAVSAFAVVLSIVYNRQELAILATIGGFVTPFLVSTGNENYIALFLYLCILNAGLTALSWFKRWPAINSISLFFTTIIFGGWLFKRLVWEEGKDFPALNAFLFATIFYALFIIMNIINTLRLKNKFSAFDFVIVLGVNFLYYASGIVISEHWQGTDAAGYFTLGLGLVNLALTAVFSKKKSTDNNFVALLTGLSLTFISLTAPVMFNGNHIVLYWSAETVLLLFLYLRTRILLLRVASEIVLVAMLISLAANWSLVYNNNNPLQVLLNKGFITGLLAAISLFIYYRLYKQYGNPDEKSATAQRATSWLAFPLAIAVLYLTGLLEIYHQFDTAYSSKPVYTIFLQAYTFGYVAALLLLFKKKNKHTVIRLVLTAICFVFYFININTNQDLSLAFMTGYGNPDLFIFHWMADALLLWLLYDAARYFCNSAHSHWNDYRPAILWIVVSGMVILLSIELYHVVMWIGYRDEQDWAGWRNLYQKAGLSILWGICSFMLMYAGMRMKLRTLRIISLSLFTITLVKLFAFDIRNIPPGGKIAAFILLGVLLLVVSFMYQRLKKIIIDNKQAD